MKLELNVTMEFDGTSTDMTDKLLELEGIPFVTRVGVKLEQPEEGR